jgi:hypothetical protein
MRVVVVGFLVIAGVAAAHLNLVLRRQPKQWSGVWRRKLREVDGNDSHCASCHLDDMSGYQASSRALVS